MALKAFITGDGKDWQEARRRAGDANGWFTEEELSFAINQIARDYLDPDQLYAWIKPYEVPVPEPRRLGIVMAGNIPLVGFHDVVCGWMSGHELILKASSKDAILWQAILEFLHRWDEKTRSQIQLTTGPLKAAIYIATGSNNTARYFEQYFGAYPHIIRKNRTSVAILSGEESSEELSLLADDLFRYYGLGCRNVTQIYVPANYEFRPLLDAMEAHRHRIHHHKYRNNYDYHLSLYLLNKVPFLTNELVMLVENPLPFSPISVVHYQYYADRGLLEARLIQDPSIQAIVGKGHIPFGQSQRPRLADFADGIDTLGFLTRDYRAFESLKSKP